VVLSGYCEVEARVIWVPIKKCSTHSQTLWAQKHLQSLQKETSSGDQSWVNSPGGDSTSIHRKHGLYTLAYIRYAKKNELLGRSFEIDNH
jgi:hypothetical protein